MVRVSKRSGSDLVVTADLNGFPVLTDENDDGEYYCYDDEASECSQDGLQAVFHENRKSEMIEREGKNGIELIE
jgi:hypothetical protein